MDREGLERFRQAHQKSYDIALSEIQKGRKESHWMWYIFPQIKGLGFSSTAQYYAIDNLEEARAFLEDCYLGGNLRRICGELLKCKTNNPEKILGNIDAIKLRSSMTLFHCAGGHLEENRIFREVLIKFFNGKPDEATLKIVEEGNA